MTFELSYRYSHLDNEHQFGIVVNNNTDEVYVRWIFFHLGAFKKLHEITIYPFSLVKDFKGKVLREYKFCNDAERQAKMIAKRIIKQNSK